MKDYQREPYKKQGPLGIGWKLLIAAIVVWFLISWVQDLSAPASRFDTVECGSWRCP